MTPPNNHTQIATLPQELYARFSPRGMRRAHLHSLLARASWTLTAHAIRAAKRALDAAAAASLALLCSPVMLAILLVLALQGRPVLSRTMRLGRWCNTFSEFSFALPKTRWGRILGRLGLGRLPILLNVLRGHLSFVGPRAPRPDEVSPRDRAAWRRYNVRPGLINPWWLRQRTNISYGTETQADWEYLEDWSIKGDFCLALRAIPAMLYGGPALATRDEVEILGIPLDNLTMDDAIDRIVGSLGEERPAQVCFVNADCANIAWRDAEYRSILEKARLCLADGIGMKLAGRLLNSEIRQNVNGTDLFPRLCEALRGTPHGVFLLGAQPGVAEGVADWIRRNHSEVRVCGVQHGYFAPDEQDEVIRRIAASGASVLLAALGSPRQDKWIHDHLDALGVRVALGVGGLFDFYSGRIPRAPIWLREMGLEWFFRFCQEPRRMWRRYFVGNAVFLFRALLLHRVRTALPQTIRKTSEVFT